MPLLLRRARRPAANQGRRGLGRYNTLIAELICPFCAHCGRTEVDVYFGHLDLLLYQLGDRCRWIPDRAVADGGRPPQGDLDGVGSIECVHCGQDWYAVVSVRGDHFVDVQPDPLRTGSMG